MDIAKIEELPEEEKEQVLELEFERLFKEIAKESSLQQCDCIERGAE